MRFVRTYVYKAKRNEYLTILTPEFIMIITRATYQLGKYVSIDVKDYGHHNIDIVLSKTVYINNLLTKKDYSLPLQRWQQFMWYLDEIQQAVTDHKEGKDVHVKYHLGRNSFVQVNSGFPVVDLRQFWLPADKDEVQPTRKGIALKFEEFATLVKLKAEIEQVIPELDKEQPCWINHHNQESFLQCFECNPNDYRNW